MSQDGIDSGDFKFQGNLSVFQGGRAVIPTIQIIPHAYVRATMTYFVSVLLLIPCLLFAGDMQSDSSSRSNESASTSHSECAKIFLPKETINLGRVPLLSEQVIDFPLSNVGSAPLIINKIDASCGCTVVTPSEMKLDPGEEGKISVRWDVDGKPMEVARVVRVRTNDCENPELSLTIVGMTYSEIEISPRRLSFGEIRQNSNGTEQIRVLQISRLTDEAKKAKLELTSMSEHIVIKKGTLDEWGNEAYVISLAAGIPAGIYDEKIIIHTNIEDLREIEIPAVFSVVPDIRLIPGTLFLGAIQCGKTYEKKIRVFSDGVPSIELTSASCSEKNVAVRLENTNEVGEYKVALTFNGLPRDAKKAEGRIVFETNNPEKRTLTASYFGRFE